MSYVITPRFANKTEIKADIADYHRRLRWKEYHYTEQGSEDSDNEQDSGPKSFFKTKKCNLPQSAPPPALDCYMKAVESEVMASVSKSTKPNVPTNELKALKTLQEAQENGEIRLACVDKGGGVAILNTKDYVDKMKQEHQDMMYTDETGNEHPYYVSASMSEVKEMQRNIQTELDRGLERKYISKADHKAMQPNKIRRVPNLPTPFPYRWMSSHYTQISQQMERKVE